MLAISGLLFTACSDDDDTPEEVNEEEVITTMIVTLTPNGGGDAIEFRSTDIDGDGPGAPVITPNIVLAGNTTYSGAIQILNETENPAEDITEEIEEEDEEHQFFFTSTGAIDNIAYADTDGDGNPVGLSFTLSTITAGPASLSITLQHEPTKPNNGTVADAGGETDITQTFNMTVQ